MVNKTDISAVCGQYCLDEKNLPFIVLLLMALVQSVIRLPNSCPRGRIHGRTCGCKWSLLKGKQNSKGNMVEPRWKLEAKSPCFCFSGAFKTHHNLWEGEDQVIPI
jgi:hypothetical protein